MGRLPLFKTALALGAALLAGVAEAQTDFSVRSPGGTRPFAQPLYWLTMKPDDRLPIRERLLVPQVGLTGKAPPPSRRTGLSPWVSGGMEFNNGDASGDPVLTFAPGVSFRHVGRRLSFSGGYALEAAMHARRSDLNRLVQGHGGFATLTYALGPRTQLSLFDILSDSRDTRDAPLQGAVVGATRLVSNTLVAGLRHAPGRRSLVDLSYHDSLFLIAAPGAADLRETGLTASYHHALSETASLSALASLTRFDFAGAPGAARLLAEAGYTRDLGARLALSFGLGVVHGGGVHGARSTDHTRLRYRGEVVHTNRFARYRLGAEGDIIAVPGLSHLARSDEISGSALLRLAPGLVLDVSMGLQRIGVLDPGATEVSVVSASGTLSYALNRDLWLWTQLELSRERSGGTTRDDNRLVIGVSRSLGR